LKKKLKSYFIYVCEVGDVVNLLTYFTYSIVVRRKYNVAIFGVWHSSNNFLNEHCT
jgi:hypothetical protein